MGVGAGDEGLEVEGGGIEVVTVTREEVMVTSVVRPPLIEEVTVTREEIMVTTVVRSPLDVRDGLFCLHVSASYWWTTDFAILGSIQRVI